MEFNAAIESLKKLQIKMHAYNHAMSIIYYDSVTVAPPETAKGRGQTLGILSEDSYQLFANKEVGELLAYLLSHKEEADPQSKREIEELKRDYDMLSKIPVEEYVEYTMLLNDADSAWRKAKEGSDFALFQPYLEKIIEFNHRFAGLYDPDKLAYDALLDQYERGLTMEKLDHFFSSLSEELVPLVKKIAAFPAIDDRILHQSCPIEAQRRFADFLMDILGMDKRYSALGETEHPFTINFNKYDVRITTHYYEDDFISSMFSVIHEGGHALYELNIDDSLMYSRLGEGVSMGVHESQSRFYENIIGRSEPFIKFIIPKLAELFPDNFAKVDAKQFYRAVNKVEASLIRIEADELTYPFHVMIRYQLEKSLISGSLSVAELPAEWNRLYKEYLGVEVPDDKHGVLQDSHWSGGNIGYFPSYALGSAYGAQMLAAMEKEIDVWGPVGRGDLSPITDWLRKKVHQHGAMRLPADTVKYACGTDFDPSFYIDYLKNKYSRIYDL